MSGRRPVVLLAAMLAAPLAAQVRSPGYPGDLLRQRLGVAIPQATTMVVAHAVAQHHTRFETSVVAVRGANRVWTVERTTEESSGLLQMTPKAYPVERTTLAPAAGAALDRLLAKPAASTERIGDDRPSIGGAWWEMAVVTPKRTRRVAWHGRLTGVFGRIADIVVGPG